MGAKPARQISIDVCRPAERCQLAGVAYFGVMMKRVSILSVLAIVMAGCASVSNSDSQDISITARDRVGHSLEGVDCTWKNDKGEGVFKAPALVHIRRGGASLHIICKHPQLGTAIESVDSRASSAMGGGNLLAGGLIGVAVDHASGAGYQYPKTVSVWFSSVSSNAKGDLKSATDQKGSNAWMSEMGRSLRAAHPESGFANLDDIEAIPKLSGNCKDRYRNWLGQAYPRAFSISTEGNCGYTWGTTPSDTTLPADPVERSLFVCNRLGKGPCKLYAIDDKVVWVKE